MPLCFHLSTPASQTQAMQQCRQARTNWACIALQVEAKEEVDTPVFLMQSDRVQRMVAEHRPHFVPVRPGGSATPAADPATGIVQRRLSNGVALNARVSDVEPQAALLRLSCVGGRVSEPSTSAPDGQGQALALMHRSPTLSPRLPFLDCSLELAVSRQSRCRH